MVDRKGPHTLPPSAAAQAPSAGNVPSRSPGSRSKPLYSIVVIRTYYAITPRLEKACFFIFDTPHTTESDVIGGHRHVFGLVCGPAGFGQRNNDRHV